MDGTWVKLIVAIIYLSTTRVDSMEDGSDAFEKGLRELVEDIRRTQPDLALDPPTEGPVNGSLFQSFPCPRLPPSIEKPTSVHKLRPGDIDVVAAIGDSYTAAKAAGGQGLSALLHDYRGLSWSVGGDGTFQTLHSLPNILKEYNPDIYGFSNSIGSYMSLEAGLNVAKSGATSTDLAFQAALLIQRLKNDPLIDFDNNWKLITILIGGNDLCRSCHAYYNPHIYLKHLQSALDMIQSSVPKAFVNLVELMPVELVRQLPKGVVCERIQNFYCQCAAFPKSEEDYYQLIQERKEFQKLTEKLISSGVYDKKDDFTVVLQPFYRNATIPTIPGTGNIDYSMFAVDCFHYSAKGQSRAGLGLWNNMFQPINNKSTNWKYEQKILCPSEAEPFLTTRKNSEDLIMGISLKEYSWTTADKLSKANQEQWVEIKASGTANVVAMKKVEAINESGKPPQKEDVERLQEGLTIMIIATVVLLLLVILAGVLYYGIGLLRRRDYGPYEKI